MAEMEFDQETDVVVVGYGFAGAVSAIEAHDANSEVIVLEKAPVPGGISICSQGAICCSKESDEAFNYLQATNGGRIPDDVVRALAEGMAECEDQIRTLGKLVDAEISTRPRGGNYPFPNRETFYYSHVDAIPNFEPSAVFPDVNGRVGGPFVFRVLQANVQDRGIPVHLGSPAKRLIYNENREVLGIIAEIGGSDVRIRARKGVELAAGGFEAAEDMKQEYWQLMPVLTAANKYNTGDGQFRV